jgi:tetratricopeptide (TPR) repeat protein
MKIIVYAICKNEAQFVARFCAAAREADQVIVVDTGSTDETCNLLVAHGATVHQVNISPWRFDDARNAALAALPEDIDMCVSLDMDEVITPGWKEILTEAWERGINRPRYKHIWSWNEDGSPGLEFSYDHIHGRKGFRWRHPVHECINSYGIEEKQEWLAGIETHHHPDPSKSRSQYLPLLAMSVKEDPYNDRNAFYYGRELYFYGRYMEAAQELKRHLELPTAHWAPERAASMRFIGKSLPAEAEIWFRKAIDQAPGRREPYVDLAKLYYERQDWEKCLEAAQGALAIEEKPLEYLCEAEAWGSAPHDYASIAAYYLGNYKTALKYAKNAMNIEPENERLKNNFIMCKSKVKSSSRSGE